MKYLILILVLSNCFSCNSQIKTKEEKPIKRTELKPPFSNQGEQENYWAQELFKKEYKPKKYHRYSREIEVLENDIIRFGKVQHIKLSNSDSKYKLIFTSGLLHPDVLGELELRVSFVEELGFLSDSPKIKRFRFWLDRPNMANFQVFVFELKNEEATEKTDWNSFIQNAKLTFVKEGWIII